MQEIARSHMIAILAAIFCLPTASAQQPDSPESEDHHTVSRYDGSFIDGYEVKEFDEFVLPLGPAVRHDAGEKVAEQQEVLESRITRILYRGPNRMRSAGIGFQAPVATNDTPTGRAKNRHVELVKQ